MLAIYARWTHNRDLPQLVDLIECAFGDDLALTGSQMVQDMRQLVQWGPLVGLAQALLKFLVGFVWVEDGCVVGNVSLNETLPGVYTVSNVAVLPAHRGRGIAGALVDAAVLKARQSGGQRVLLQVRDDNAVAQTIYRHRGFVRYDTLHEMNIRPSQWPVILGETDVRLRSVRMGDGRKLRRLVVASSPASTLAQLPIQSREYARGLWWQMERVAQFALNGRDHVELVAEENGQAVAYIHVTTHLWSSPYQLQLAVLPSHRGLWERPLLDGMLRRIQSSPKAALRANISALHPEAIHALSQAGFTTLRVLDQMALQLV